MKSVFPIIFLVLSLLLAGCSSEIIQVDNKTTILTVRTTFKDSNVHPKGYVYLFDADENQLKDSYSDISGSSIAIGIINDVNGKIVAPIGTEKLHDNTTPGGGTGDYSFALFNLDKIMPYTQRTKGSILVAISLDNANKLFFTYKTIQWEKEQVIEITKQFEGGYSTILSSYEEW